MTFKSKIFWLRGPDGFGSTPILKNSKWRAQDGTKRNCIVLRSGMTLLSAGNELMKIAVAGDRVYGFRKFYTRSVRSPSRLSKRRKWVEITGRYSLSKTFFSSTNESYRAL